MSNEANETIADIVAEKRREAQHIRNINDTPRGRREALDLDEEADRIEAAYGRHEAELCDLKRENDRLLAALKPVLECRVISDVFALALRGACMKKLSELISEAQRIYNGGGESEAK